MNKRNTPMTVHVTEEFHAEIANLSHTERRSMSSLMYNVLRDYADKAAKRNRNRKRAA